MAIEANAAVEVKVPVLPESVQDATIATWHKQKGDRVRRDENLVDLETDKVVLEVPAPADGILSDILKPAGAVVHGGEILAVLQSGGSTEAVQANPASAPLLEVEAKKTSPISDLGPSARRAAGETGVDPAAVTGSGKAGRVTRADIVIAAKVAPVASVGARTGLPQTVSTPVGARTEKRVPMTRLRARIAQRLVEAQQTAAILTTFNEVNMHAVMDLRARYQKQFEEAHGVRLGFMSFFVRAVTEALKRFPLVNASIDGEEIVYHGYFDIGVAVSSDRGLVVPVLRDADQKSLAEIEKEIKDFSARAQKGQLSLEDMTGGTFTLSNGGVFGSLLATPILNPPQSGILGMHKIEERPIVEQGEIVIRPMMYIALSYDHRIIDGKESVTFLRTVKELLEDPARLLLDL
jgi:2-oxoglutarate dehydrogenase E2 component (dihydrolipoamide succinyltransferase)